MKDIKAMQYIEFDVVKFENSSTLRFILIRLRYCTRPLRSTHFFISIILITTNERIYIKNLEFINFDIFASKEILRNLDTLSLYKIYIISLVIIINDEKKYIKIYIDWKEWKTPFEDSKCSIGGTEREFRPRTFQISRKRFERSRVTQSFHYVANKVSRRFHYIRAHFAYIFTGETPERCLPFTRNNDILRSSPTPAHRKRQFELQIHVRHFTIVTSSPNSPIYSSQ